MSGGGSKEQTVGYKVFLGLQAVLTHGPVDFLLRLRWDDRDAWTGKSSGGSVSVNKPGLFGNEEREGGIVGTIDFEQGGPAQTANSYLSSKMGGTIPAFRGVTQLVMRQLYWGMNPYLKKFSAWLQRIHTTTDGATQWYDEKAEVQNLSGLALPIDADGWSYQIKTESMVNPGYDNIAIPTSGWIDGAQAPFAGGTTVSLGNTNWPIYKALWVKRTLKIPGSLSQILTVQAENGCIVFIDGVLVGDFNRSNVQVVTSPPFEVELAAGRTLELVIKAFDEDGSGAGSSTLLRVSTYIPGAADMNPAHIIRECLIDPDWGMGHTAEDINDTDFMAAADQLYDESFGISILWDKQATIEEFIKLILKHIGAVLDIDNNGKWSLRLIRDNYNYDDLTVLGPSEISKVENHTFQAAGEFVNSVTVQYWDAATGKDASVTESDSALCQMQGAVVNTTVEYPGICNKALASRVAKRDMIALSTPLHSLTATIPVEYAEEFENGDVFVLNWPEHKIVGVVMRIMKIDRGTGKSTAQRFTLTQDVFGLPDAGTVTVSDTDWEDPITPSVALTTRNVIEAPYRELIQFVGADQVDSKLASNSDIAFLLVSAMREGSAYNAQVWTDAGAGYAQQNVMDFSPVVQLLANVDYDDKVWTVTDLSDDDLIEVGDMGQIGNECVVVTAKSTGSISVGRGVIDTVPEKHVVGDKLIIFDRYGSVDQTEYATGGTVSAKLLPVSGNGPLDISIAPSDSVTFDRRAIRPYPPGNVKIGGVRYPTSVSGAFTITWSHRNRVSQADSLFDTEAGDVTPADNTRYGLRFLDNTDTLIIERTDIGPGTATVTLNYTGDVTCELYTINNTDESMQRHRFTFAYTPPGGSPVNTITATAYTPVSEDPIIDGGP